jgi:hypothetical protein
LNSFQDEVKIMISTIGMTSRFVKVAAVMNAAISVSFTRMARGGVATLFLCFVIFANQASAGSPPDIFADHPSATAADLLGKHKPDPTVIRERPVKINIQPLSAVADQATAGVAMQRISLNLFPNVRHVFIPERSEKSGDGKFTILIGSIAGGKALMNNGTLVFGDGVVTGNIRPGWGSVIYQIRVSPTGIQTVQEVDTNKFPVELEPIPVAPPAAPDKGGSAAPNVSPQGFNAPVAAPDDGTTINVMVVYTPAARLAVGGVAAMQSLIALGVSETNQGYTNSGVIQRITLAHSAEVVYTEVVGAGAAFSPALSALTSKTDGVMDEVHTLRDTYKADMVSLWINDTGSCGLAWLMTTASLAFESSAFSVVHHGCATGYYSFGHEMGHNQGAHHDVAVAGGGTGVYPYSHGWVDTMSQFRTIMAYGNACGNCTRINYWSNPNGTYLGRTTGDTATANNALSHNNTVSIAANWRSSGVATYTVSATAGTGGSVTPASRSVVSGATASFTVAALTGYATPPTVGGTCVAGTFGTWASNSATYTTGAVTAACSVSFTFTPVSATTGSLTVNISPAGAVTSGAQWSVDGGTTWNASGTTLSNLVPGGLTVTFSVATGYTSPVDQAVTITAGQTTTVTGTYTVGPYYTASATATGGTVTPANRSVLSGATASFAVTVGLGYSAPPTVGGTCLAGIFGTWANGSATYTTDVVTADCTVDFTFAPLPPSAPTATTGGVGGISSTGEAVVNGLVNPNGDPATVDFEYGTDTMYGNLATGGTVTGWTTQTVSSAALTGLTCGTTYYYRVTATNAIGTTVGLDATFVACKSKTYGDFNGDGKSDILWRNAATGATQIWFMNGTTKSGGGVTNVSAGTYTATAGWQVHGEGDFNGDGKADILWRNAKTGAAMIWLMNGTAKSGGGATSVSPGVYTATTGLQAQGIGDFNGDGKADILWRNAATGATQIWFMNGATQSGGGATSASPGAYAATYGLQIQGVGDFDGDGKADILFRHVKTGATYIWFMNGVTKTSSAATSASAGAYTATTGWQVQGVADFDGDGKADILWRNVKTGATAIWFMNGATRASAGLTSASPGVYTATTGLQVQGVGDYNGDGMADILFRHVKTGVTYIWYMNGITITGGGGTSAYAGGYTATWGWQIMRKP